MDEDVSVVTTGEDVSAAVSAIADDYNQRAVEIAEALKSSREMLESIKTSTDTINSQLQDVEADMQELCTSTGQGISQLTQAQELMSEITKDVEDSKKIDDSVAASFADYFNDVQALLKERERDMEKEREAGLIVNAKDKAAPEK